MTRENIAFRAATPAIGTRFEKHGLRAPAGLLKIALETRFDFS